MKTPSFLLLAAALASALPAAASREPEQRCDTEFLERAAAVFGEGGVYREQRIQIQNVLKPGGGTIEKMRLSHLHEHTVCDATVDWLIRRRASTGVRNQALMTLLDTADAGGQARALLVIDDFYKDFDQKALAAIASADAALDAAARLGLIDSPREAPAGAKPLRELIPADGQARPATGGPIGVLVPRHVELLAADRQRPATLTVEEVGAAFRVLLDDGGRPGEGVLAFRQALLGLGVELEKHGKSRALVKKRLGEAEGITDFVGLGSYESLPATKENASEAEKYKAGLHALVGQSVPDIGDATERPDALLDAVDVGLRNLLAIRSDQLDKIMELAKARLDGKPISQYETSLRLARQRTERKVGENTLAAATLEALAGDKDYQDLDRLYHDALRRVEGNESKLKPEEKAAGEALQRIQAAAASAATATDGKPMVSYTLDGRDGSRRLTLESVVPPAEGGAEDEQKRRELAADISRDILAGNLGDAKLAAALAALRGQEPEDDAAAREPGRPPVTTDRPPEPQSAWDALADSADAGCGVNPANLARGKAERAALRQNERAAEEANELSGERRALQESYLADLRAVDEDCDKQLAAIESKPRSARLTAEAKAAQIREESNALESRCNDRKSALERDYVAKRDAIKARQATAAESLVLVERQRGKWYSEGVPQALNDLRTEYKTGDRRAELVKKTFDDDTFDAEVDKFFAAIPADFPARCAAALGYDADPDARRFSDPAKLKDPTADNVNELCRTSVEVHKDKVADIRAACEGDYATAVGSSAERVILTGPVADALCAHRAAQKATVGTSGPVPEAVRRRGNDLPQGED